ncbi:zinc finger CCHC domain-containing protein 10-like [Diabrotica virgifera virgifera]|uniref:Suppressor protein SRP40-like n=1 Tax=Diabrotica virgifera virgifera TaxID=50390 RepID=A0ABM5JSS5_DIAVI|nr:zinc finger CCHC domain-containing protein 10-like [Diabrotica virgifera virgifera]
MWVEQYKELLTLNIEVEDETAEDKEEFAIAFNVIMSFRLKKIQQLLKQQQSTNEDASTEQYTSDYTVSVFECENGTPKNMLDNDEQQNKQEYETNVSEMDNEFFYDKNIAVPGVSKSTSSSSSSSSCCSRRSSRSSSSSSSSSSSEDCEDIINDQNYVPKSDEESEECDKENHDDGNNEPNQTLSAN